MTSGRLARWLTSARPSRSRVADKCGRPARHGPVRPVRSTRGTRPARQGLGRRASIGLDTRRAVGASYELLPRWLRGAARGKLVSPWPAVPVTLPRKAPAATPTTVHSLFTQPQAHGARPELLQRPDLEAGTPVRERGRQPARTAAMPCGIHGSSTVASVKGPRRLARARRPWLHARRVTTPHLLPAVLVQNAGEGPSMRLSGESRPTAPRREVRQLCQALA